MEALRVVPAVDLDRYLGTWYEIARYPNRFQKNCVASVAIYSKRDDGTIRVENTCRDGSLDGKVRRVVGKAWPVEGSNHAKLKVQFFWPFRGDYWIIDLDPDYRYAVVGHPARKYLWVLARAPSMDPALYESLLEKIRAQGYDLGRLERTPQPGAS
jgi:apolipoprotein D and lipocalin family protein